MQSHNSQYAIIIFNHVSLMLFIPNNYVSIKAVGVHLNTASSVVTQLSDIGRSGSSPQYSIVSRHPIV